MKMAPNRASFTSVKKTSAARCRSSRSARPCRPRAGKAEQEIVDRPGEIEADEEGEQDREQRPDQPPPELDQMLHQRRLGRLDSSSCVIGGSAGFVVRSRLPLFGLVEAARLRGGFGFVFVSAVGCAVARRAAWSRPRAGERAPAWWNSPAVDLRQHHRLVERGGFVAHALHRLLHLGHFGVADGIVELTLELGGARLSLPA